MIVAKARLDSFTYAQMTSVIAGLRAEGRTRIAIDLKATSFLSLPAIRFMVAMAEELLAVGGELIVLSPSDKAVRHLKIYGDLAAIRVEKSIEGLGPGAEIRRHEIRVADVPAIET